MIEFNVIGEMRQEPGHLLLLDRDGTCYEYDIALDTINPIEPGNWALHVIEEGQLTMLAPESKIAFGRPRASRAS